MPADSSTWRRSGASRRKRLEQGTKLTLGLCWLGVGIGIGIGIENRRSTSDTESDTDPDSDTDTERNF